MTPWLFFAQGAGLGLSAAGTPGPLTALLISETLRRGWRRGVLVALAPVLSDAPIILVTTFVLGQLPPMALRIISIAGGLFVLRLAWRLLQAWRHEATMTDVAPTDLSAGHGLRQAVVINYLSPGPYIYWALVNGPLLLSAWEQSPIHAILFLAGFYGVFVGSMAAMVATFDRARRLGPRVARALMLASVLMLFVFAGVLLSRPFLVS
jgi:threonine/homoserine/homoserine lactone efflux protein